MPDVVTVERFIPTTPDRIFALISDPRRHHEFDGSGTVKQARNVPDHLELGATFGMNMVLGVPYAMRSTVVEYEEDKLLAWQTRAPVRFVDPFAGGRIWRYELEPTKGGTLVKESWDIREESPVTRPIVRRAAEQTRRNMAKTLERIETVLCSS